MSKRYEEEISLRLRGDTAECKKYIARARTVLGEVWVRDIELGGLDQAWRSVVLDDRAMVTVYATKYHNPVVTITVLPRPTKPDQKFIDQLRMVWVPEGLVFTPVSEQYEKGWGLPTRDKETGEVLSNTDELTGEVLHPPGVAGGIWPQVIINRFKNNKYLDKKEFITGLPNEVLDRVIPDNPLLRESWDTAVAGMDTFILMLPWQGVYNPLRCADINGGELAEGEDNGIIYWTENQTPYPQVPGAYLGDTLVFPQFGGYARDSLIYEPEISPDEVTGDQEWFAHRAEEVLYFTAGQEGCFQQTNVIRAAVDRGPMHRIVRGHPNIARMSVTEVVISGKQFHDSDEFRPGYNKVLMRFFAGGSTGNALTTGENLLITPDIAGDFDSGVAAAEAWRDSPPHYANQIYFDWTEDEDIPGAEHFNAYLPATVDEALYAGELNPPARGVEWCQLFSRQQSWVAVPFRYHDTGPRFVGNYGKINDQCRGRYYGQYYLFISFMGGIISIPNELVFDDEPFDPQRLMGVFGATSFEGHDGQAMFRCVVCVSPYMDTPPQPWWRKDCAEFTLYVLSRPIALTDWECDWVVEASKTFKFVDGWVGCMAGSVKFSPNGKKFVFELNKRGNAYTHALTDRTLDFSNDRTPLLNPRRTIDLIRIEYEAKDSIEADIAPTYTFTEMREEPLSTVIDCSSAASGTGTGYEYQSRYERTLDGEINLFADYDDNSELVYVKLYVHERQYQTFHNKPNPAPHTRDNWCYRVRKLIFPSGKEVYMLQQYMRGVVVVESLADIESAGWHIGDGTAENYFCMIHHINVRTEDIVYTKRYSRLERYFVKQPTFLHYGGPWHYEYGRLEIIFDGGVKNVGTEETNIVEVLYAEPEMYFGSYSFISEYTTYGTARTDFDLDGAASVYQMSLAPAARFFNATFEDDGRGGGITNISGMAGHTLPAPIGVGPSPEELNGANFEFNILVRNAWDRPAYNQYPKIEHVDHDIGRPPFEGHECSVILGLPELRGRAGLYETSGSSVWYGSSIWQGESTGTANIAPIMLSEDTSQCHVARYKDRVMIRMENFAWPWGGVGEFVFTGVSYPQSPPYSPILQIESFGDIRKRVQQGDPSLWTFRTWTDVPEDAKLIIWANFDLDEAAGISDVTDIQPFGRAG